MAYMNFNIPHITDNTMSCVVSSFVTNKIDAKTWHHRLGHVSYHILNKMCCILVPHSCIPLCIIYPLAKQHRLPFPVSTHKSSSVFDLIHCDLWGPYRIQTNIGCKYFLTIVDDFRRATWTFLMPTKHHVISLLTKFLTYSNKQFSKYVKILRSDNGTEFFNDKLTALLDSHGILHHSSCVKTPQ